MFKVEIYLCVCAKNPLDESDISYLLTKRKDKMGILYEQLKSGTKVWDVVTGLLESHTGVTEHWALPSCYGIIDNLPEKNTLGVLYGVYIPEKTNIRISKDQWISYSDIINSREILSGCTIELIHETMWRKG